MDISGVTASSAMVAAIRNLQAIAEAQMQVMKAITDGQKQMAAVAQANGVGQSINTYA